MRRSQCGFLSQGSHIAGLGSHVAQAVRLPESRQSQSGIRQSCGAVSAASWVNEAALCLGGRYACIVGGSRGSCICALNCSKRIVGSGRSQVPSHPPLRV